ncbi:MAG: FtsX-like permease family protein [Oscillospiraceae bacterium]|nr:FtsX-like permease family protein [Oscillospiraceae bacterium]
MGLLESLRLSFEGLRSNKMRSLLTMLGIIIGIAAVIGILTVGDGLSSSITGTMSGLGASTISISLRETESADPMSGMMGMTGKPDEEDLISEKMIQEMQERYAEDIAAVSLSESVGSGRAKDGRLYANVGVTGVNNGYFAVDDLELLAGRFLEDRDDEGGRMVCVVSDKLVSNMFGGDQQAALGSELSVEVGADRLRLRIVGIYKYEASAFLIYTGSERDISTSLYIPLSAAKRLSGGSDGFSNITVLARADADSSSVAARLEEFLGRYYRRNDDYSISATSMESIIASVNDMMGTLSIAIAVIAAISLLVGGIGVMNIMLVSVTERTREIGTRKALGATNANIQMQFVVESALICLVGGVIGIILGAAFGYLGSTLLGVPTLPDLGSVALAAGFSLAVGIFFGYYPASKAAKMDPIEALRYE